MNKKVAFALISVLFAAVMLAAGHLIAFAACWVASGIGMDVSVAMFWRVSEIPMGQWYFGWSLGFGASTVFFVALVGAIRDIPPESNLWKKPERSPR